MDNAGSRALSTLNRGLSGTVRATLPTRVLDDLLARMHAILGAKFAEMYAGQKDAGVMREEWGHHLADMKPVELERGLRELASRKFPPTLGEFRLFCRPTLDPEWAFHHARVCLLQRDQGAIGDWSHPAEWRAAAEMSREVRVGEYATVRNRWKVLLEAELAKGWGAGEIAPPPPLKIEDRTKTSGNSPAALEARAKLRAMFNKPKESQ